MRSPVCDLVVAARKDRVVASDDRRHLRVGRDGGVAERDAEHVAGRVLVDVELSELHLALCEDVRLPGRRDTDDPADRVGGLELGRDDEVDVELALAPEVDVLGARRADHGRRALGLASREHACDEVHLVSRRAGDHEVGGVDPRRCHVLAARPVALEDGDVEASAHRLKTGCLGVEDGDLVLVVEGLHDGRADLPRPDDEDPHERVAYCRVPARYNRWLPWLACGSAVLVLLGAARRDAHRLGDSVRRARFARSSCARGFDEPGAAHLRRENRGTASLRRRAARDVRVIRIAGRAANAFFLDIRSAGRVRRRAGASRARLRSRSTRTNRFDST